MRMRAAAMIREAGIALSDTEAAAIEVVGFGLGHPQHEGAQIVTLVATDRYAVKVLALFPGQTEPEHWHPPVGDDPGKQETIRIVSGELRFYTSGTDTLHAGNVPQGKEQYYTCRHEHVMKPGDQLTLEPGAPHWFQPGSRGCVLFSFSSVVRDACDGFSDPAVRRV
ncbi:MAG: D-lyxose/D-mannose family sugar isomerase [Chitinivibrionales bacterium]|nr:D-lyxose/D-mannose family sugar isomerase [Chitinivibrionales bacterium]